MNALVIHRNNLKYALRACRNIEVLAKHMDHVQLLLCPIDDDTCEVQGSNIDHSFFDFQPFEENYQERMLAVARELDIETEILSVAPVLAIESIYATPEILQEAYSLQESIFSSQRWSDVRKGIPEPLPLMENMGTLLGIVQKALLLAREAVAYPADIVCCSDYITLIAGVAHKKKYGSRLVYDIPDIFYNELPYLFCRLSRYIAAMIEYTFTPYADVVMSVGRRMIEILQQHYRLPQPMLFIPNCSGNTETFPVRECAERVRFYFQGIAKPLSGLEDIIQALELVPEALLVLRCLPSANLDLIKESVERSGVADRITFLDPVPPDRLVHDSATSGDVGISLISVPVHDPSYYVKIAMTTKFVDYVQAGMPVLTMEEMEQGAVTERYNCGVTIGTCTPESIAAGMRYFIDHRDEYREMSANALRAHRELFSWDQYEPLFVDAVCKPQPGAPQMLYLSEEQLWQRQEREIWQTEFITELLATQRYDNELLEKQREMDALWWENQGLEQLCGEYENSTSLRLTEPLRKLRGFFRRLFHRQ